MKAAFIYNFAKFTAWPPAASPTAEPIVLCVLGDADVGEALAQTVKGRALGGRSMSVSLMTHGGPSRKCHLLYVSGGTAAQAAQLLSGLRDEPVLTISDLESFTELGGIARFFFEHGQLRFSVNLESALRAHLQISSKLMGLSIRK